MLYFLEGKMNLDGLIYLILAIMFGPAILLTIIGLAILKKNKKAAKVLFILAAIYVIVSLGVCGAMIL
ncbi:hypothetical protein Q4Q34_07635 [Flavivirga abyssicola]|uniref:hypothetical protein n=1 Tax=Flavivirga abyssicola TaxID=3063533 RepID=UPI0026DFFD11|nr:hypothetical protein [Flavivirga sp. MEBiC07777]WVK14898.1 hypothetical protein Q4Q34_07635 [Flavivirga sp. MEBiC07777]